MSKTGILLLSLALVAVTAAGTAGVSQKSNADIRAFEIRKIDRQVVLYTIYRGSYGRAGMAIGNLFALAGRKGIQPRGSASYTYLNNPDRVSSEHWLTEIRIPVGEQALKLAGTLGDFTDVKELPATQAAVATKPEGLADPAPLYRKLYNWIHKQGYAVTDAHSEVFLTNVMGGHYAQMKTHIYVPVEKLTIP